MRTGKTKNDILIEIYNDKTYQTICKAFTKGQNWEDLHSIFLAIMCGKTEEKLLDIYYNYNVDYINNYCCQVLVNQYYSSASTFYYQFRRYNLTHKSSGNEFDILSNIPEIEDEHQADSILVDIQSEKEKQDIMQQINSIVDKQHWYNARLFRMWLDKGSVRKVSDVFKDEKIKISNTAVKKSIRQTKTIIRNTLKNPFTNQ